MAGSTPVGSTMNKGIEIKKVKVTFWEGGYIPWMEIIEPKVKDGDKVNTVSLMRLFLKSIEIGKSLPSRFRK